MHEKLVRGKEKKNEKEKRKKKKKAKCVFTEEDIGGKRNGGSV